MLTGLAHLLWSNIDYIQSCLASDEMVLKQFESFKSLMSYSPTNAKV
jgi:hypothetical protein